MSNRSYSGIKGTFGTALALLAICGEMQTASAQTAQFSYALFPVGGASYFRAGFVAVDGRGNVYVPTTGFEAVVEVPPGCASIGCITRLGGGFSMPSGVAVDGSGNVYVSDIGDNAVKEMPPGCGSSSCVTTLGGGFSYSYGVAVDGSSNVYVADTGNSAVKEMPPGCTSSSCVTTLGGGFSQSTGVAVDGSGNVYVSDQNYGVAEMPPGCASSSCVKMLGDGFNAPAEVAVDDSGNIYVADGNAVKEMPPGCTSSSCVTTLVGGFDDVIGVAVDGSGNYYAVDADGGLGSVDEFLVHGVNFYTVPVGATSSYTLSDQSTTSAITLTFTFGSAGSIGAPKVLTQGAPGLDFADAGTGSCTTNGTSHVYSAGDICTVNVTFTPTKAGTRYGGVELLSNSGAVIANSYVYGTGTGPQVIFLPGALSTLGGGFTYPEGVAVDGTGNVYIADTENNAVKEMPPGCASSSCVTTLGGGFTNPYGVAVDGSGNVYVADTHNNAVKELPPGCASSSCVTTLGGGFTNPYGVAVDGSGNVYVVDSYNNAVKEMPPGCASSSCVATLAGGFLEPQGVALDGSGNVYIADTGNNAAKELNFANPPILSFALTGVGKESSDSPQTVTLKNIGNAALSLPVPTSGTNPEIAGYFTLDSTTTCPQITSSSSPGMLAADASCTLAVDFFPQISGTVDAGLALTDNNLNAHYATQVIVLSGVGEVAPQTINFGALANVTYGVSPIKLTATASSGLPVSYTVTGPATVSGSTLTIIGAGTVTVTASQAGNSNYGAATPVSQSFTVSKAPSATRLTAATTTPTKGQADQLTATVTGAGQPRGTVLFTAGSTSLCTSTLGTSGVATCSYVPADTGSVTVSAQYQGDTNHLTSTAKLTLTVKSGYDATVVLKVHRTELIYPERLEGEACVTSVTREPATSAIKILDGSRLLAKQELRRDGCAHWEDRFDPGVGTHDLTAAYSGDSRNPAGVSAPVTVTVTPGPVKLELRCRNANLIKGQTLHCEATARDRSFPVSGTLGYTIKGNGGEVTLSQGRAPLDIPDPPLGSDTLTITFAAQGNYQAAQPVSVSFTVTAP
jgi:streptogramin lyase